MAGPEKLRAFRSVRPSGPLGAFAYRRLDVLHTQPTQGEKERRVSVETLGSYLSHRNDVLA